MAEKKRVCKYCTKIFIIKSKVNIYCCLECQVRGKYQKIKSGLFHKYAFGRRMSVFVGKDNIKKAHKIFPKLLDNVVKKFLKNTKKYLKNG